MVFANIYLLTPNGVIPPKHVIEYTIENFMSQMCSLNQQRVNKYIPN